MYTEVKLDLCYQVLPVPAALQAVVPGPQAAVPPRPVPGAAPRPVLQPQGAGGHRAAPRLGPGPAGVPGLPADPQHPPRVHQLPV